MTGTETSAQGHLDDLCRLARALAGPADAKGLVEVCPRLIALADELGDLRARAEGCQYLGVGHGRLGEFQLARDAYREAIQAAQEAGNSAVELRARQGLVNALELMGEPHGALVEAEIVAKASDWFLRCTGLISIASVQQVLAEYASAMDYLRQAEEVLHASTAVPRQVAYVQAYISGNEANIRLDTGDLTGALQVANRMDAAAVVADDRSQGLEALINIGLARMRLGDLGEAWHCLGQAHQAAALACDRHREAVAGAALAEWHTYAGLIESAVGHATTALQVAAASKSRFAELEARLCLGAAHLEAGEPGEAAAPIGDAMHEAEQLQAPHYRVRAEILTGRACLGTGDPTAAAQILEAALERADALGMSALAIRARIYLARARHRLGDAQAANEMAREAWDEADARGARHEQWRAAHTRARALEDLGQTEESLKLHREATRMIEAMWWPLWRIGFAEVQSISPAILDVYTDYLRLATHAGLESEVRRVLSVSPWPFLKRKWSELGKGEPSGAQAFEASAPTGN
jgi:tetratricopeptide (TPR) repeat protein